MTKKIIFPNLLTTLTTSLALSSCAGPESYQQKMARYTPKAEIKNTVPDIKINDFKFAQIPTRNSRGPASVEEAKLTPKKEEIELNSSNKKLYFLSLYTQFETLKTYSTDFNGPSLSICPNFHTSLLRHNEKMKSETSNSPLSQKFTYDSKKISDDSYVSKFPELLLPLSKDETTPRVIDIVRGDKELASDQSLNEIVHKAIDIHLSKTYSEIRELCEYGVSDNYYIYENLITHVKNNTFSAGADNMNTLLKTTIFSNMALMSSLEKQVKVKAKGRSIASVNNNLTEGPYVKEIIARLNVTWANQYFESINEK